MSPSKAHDGPEITCRCCAGTGRIRLSSGLWRVYLLVQQGYVVASEIYEQLDAQDDIQAKAVSMRLKALYDLGLIERDEAKRGRQWVYRVKEKEGESA